MAAPEKRSVELLAPAGDWECARAAVENGADAIYFGLERFNARMRAMNFTAADLPELMKYLHLRGVRGYVTFNTLIFEDEIEDAADMVRQLAAAGVDAAIVQDIGLCRLIKQIAPELEIHASTQMTITSAAGVEFAKSLGCSLAVLARECSIAEVENIKTSADGSGYSLPLEIFVHGALCVAYSGQCLTSEALGGRSANRGECAQACRMPYEMVVDGKLRPLEDKKYLLSPQDLAGIELLPQIINSGVISLKIEGRLKSPLYVASVTRTYRRALDQALAQKPVPTGSDTQYELEMAFSRGLYTGWLNGIDNQKLVHARYPKKRGVFLGTVVSASADEVKMEICAPAAPGDGVVFDSGDPQRPEEGGRIYEIERKGNSAVLKFRNGSLNPQAIFRGTRVYKTNDPQLDRELRQTFDGAKPRFKRPLVIRAAGSAGKPLTVSFTDEQGRRVEETSSLPLEPAESRPLDLATIREKLGALGDTPFEAAKIEVELEGGVFIPLPELKRIRRVLADKLSALRTAVPAARIAAPLPRHRRPVNQSSSPRLSVLVRSLEQLEAVGGSGAGRIYLDFENVKKYRDGVRLGREFGIEIYAAPPRIFKTGEEWILRQVSAAEADGILVRNYDHLKFFAGRPMAADFSFNIANGYSAEILKQHGVETLTPSYDLNAEQLTALFRAAPPDWFEVTIHQRMPMFHMEHCVFCAFLSDGKDYRDCGRPCDRHDLRLRDRTGSDLPVRADTGCRNTVFNSKAQTAAEFLDDFLKAGCERYRIDLVDETPAEAAELVRKYQSLLRGEISGGSLWRDLKLLSQLGVTRGQMGKAGLPIIPG